MRFTFLFTGVHLFVCVHINLKKKKVPASLVGREKLGNVTRRHNNTSKIEWLMNFKQHSSFLRT